nr:hypothetical protein [Tanacetum cinerariifolium]
NFCTTFFSNELTNIGILWWFLDWKRLDVLGARELRIRGRLMFLILARILWVLNLVRTRKIDIVVHRLTLGSFMRFSTVITTRKT